MPQLAQDLLSTLDRAAQPAPEPSVTVRLVAQNEGLTPQAENLLAVVLEHAPGWHTYWRMPGDAGLTTQFSFTTPKDVRLTDPRFPLPERHNDKGIVSFSYGGTAVFPFEAEIPRFPEGRSARISIHVSYLACKDVCIPGEGTAEITLPYEVAPKPSADAELVSNAIVNVPEVADIRGVRAVYEEDRLKVTVPASEVHVEKSLSFYPLDERVLKLSDEPQHQTEEDGSASILMTLAPEFLQEPRATLSGVFVGDGGPAASGWAIETSFPLEKGAVPKPAVFSGALPVAGSGASVTTLTAIVFAFLGGLILNLMPCVFPILSLKILQLIEGYRRGERLLPHGIAFTGGVLVTMGVLAGALLALRGVGMALGWGFQLQSPWVVSLLLVLFVAITINLLGVFEFTAASHLADTRVARSAPRTGAASSFFTGILAVIVASPCTAPFMGAALGYAVTQPAVEAIAVFLSLGLGMALPWLLLCIFPEAGGLDGRLPQGHGDSDGACRRLARLGALQAGQPQRHASDACGLRLRRHRALAARPRAVGPRSQPRPDGRHVLSCGRRNRRHRHGRIRPRRHRTGQGRLAALVRRGRQGLPCRRPPRLRRLHRRLVRHLSGQQGRGS